MFVYLLNYCYVWVQGDLTVQNLQKKKLLIFLVLLQQDKRPFYIFVSSLEAAPSILRINSKNA